MNETFVKCSQAVSSASAPGEAAGAAQKATGVIVGLGEALWDCLPDGRKIGGAPANFAYHTSQFGYEAYAVSAIGRDALGDETVEALAANGLKTVMPRVDYPTGQVKVTLDEDGVATYDIMEGSAWDNIPFTPGLEALARRCDAVCFGSLAQRHEVSRETIYRFLDATPKHCMRIFDINLRQHFYSKEVIQESLRRSNVMKINDEELVVIGRLFGYPGLDIENKCWLILGKYNLDMLILTCGVNGSYVFSRGAMSFCETPKVEVADTVGAGDSFTGAFVASILSGKPIAEAHRIGVNVSAFVCTQNGAMPVIPEHLKHG